MNKISFVLCFLCFILTAKLAKCVISLEPIEGRLNRTEILLIDNTKQIAVEYLLSVDDIGDVKNANLRVQTSIEVTGTSKVAHNCPILFAIHQRRQILSWELPPTKSDKSTFAIRHVDLDNDVVEYFASRTLCLDALAENMDGFIAVIVSSTCTTVPVKTSVTLMLTYDLLIPMDKEINISPSPQSTYYYRFEIPTDVDTAIVKLDSESDYCMTLSVQHPECPVFDLESNIHSSGYWQTVSKKAGLNIQRKDFSNGFFLVFVINEKDDACTNKRGVDHSIRTFNNTRNLKQLSSQRIKPVKFTIVKSLDKKEYTWPIFFPLVIYLPVLAITFAIFVLFHRLNVRNYKETSECYKSTSILRSGKYMRGDEYIDDHEVERYQRKSARFVWSMVTIAVFYCIPVFQLIVSYLGLIYRTGEQDVCYYNTLCSHPLGYVMDFNHIYSNVGYSLFGIAFILFVFIRQLTFLPRDLDNCGKLPICCNLLPRLFRDRSYGVFTHYGLFYALGFSLFMEGILSSGYHICPSQNTFQFDTSFMYAMAILSYIKVYQFRHPVYMSETLVFLALAVVAGCVVFGLISESTTYNIITSIGHLVLMTTFQFYLLYSERIISSKQKDESIYKVIFGICKELFGSLRRGNRLSRYLIPYHPNKVLFWWTLIWNVLLVIFTWTIFKGNNFATQVLYILLANLTLYVIYYLAMKTVHREILHYDSIQPFVYGAFALIFMIPGLYLFMKPLSAWALSPAQSREENADCILLGFYDNHDIWHLLSAPGLFFSFMLFLTLDDHLIGHSQQCIPVF